MILYQGTENIKLDKKVISCSIGFSTWARTLSAMMALKGLDISSGLTLYKIQMSEELWETVEGRIKMFG